MSAPSTPRAYTRTCALCVWSGACRVQLGARFDPASTRCNSKTRHQSVKGDWYMPVEAQ